MPAPVDLTGRVLGRLTVVGRAGSVRFGRLMSGWLCRCECGAEEVYPLARLPYRLNMNPRHVVAACRACRSTACLACGKPIPPRAGGGTACSRACRLNLQKTRSRDWYAAHAYRHKKRTAANAKARLAVLRERARTDPAAAEKLKAAERRRWERKRERMRTDPAYRERVRRQTAATYARHAERIQRERRDRLDRLTPEQLADWLERARLYGRRYRRRWRAELAVETRGAAGGPADVGGRAEGIAGGGGDLKRTRPRNPRGRSASGWRQLADHRSLPDHLLLLNHLLHLLHLHDLLHLNLLRDDRGGLVHLDGLDERHARDDDRGGLNRHDRGDHDGLRDDRGRGVDLLDNGGRAVASFRDRGEPQYADGDRGGESDELLHGEPHFFGSKHASTNAVRVFSSRALPFGIRPSRTSFANAFSVGG